MEDFQFQILPIPEAVSLPDQPSDLVIETFRGCVGQMMKSPVGLDPFQIVPNGPSHGFQFGDPGFLSQAAPAMKSHIGMPGVLSRPVDASQGLLKHVCIKEFPELIPDICQDAFSVFTHLHGSAER